MYTVSVPCGMIRQEVLNWATLAANNAKNKGETTLKLLPVNI